MPEIIHHPSYIVHRRGIALLAVLFIIMAITVLSLGFLARSSVESASGQNTGLRVETDELAASGLQHARGLILNPQDLSTTTNWAGGTGLQLATGSDAYDVAVTPIVSDPNDHCAYSITCDAYQTRNGSRVGESKVSAQLRLNPAIALWAGAGTTLTSGLDIHGDVYCGGSLINMGTIRGDVFATAMPVAGVKTGQLNPQTLSLTWPSISASDFTSHYTTDPLTSGTLSGPTYGPYNPPRVFYRSGNLALGHNVDVNGMLLVVGDLTISGYDLAMTAGKNQPALYVTNNLKIEEGGSLHATGLVIVGNSVCLSAGVGVLNISGGLFFNNTLVETIGTSTANEYAHVHGAPIWCPAGGRTAGALQFDGVDDYVSTPNDPAKLQLTGNCTLAAWVWADPSQNAGAGILTKCDSTHPQNHWALQFNSATPREIIAYPQEGAWWTEPWSTGILSTDLTGGWHHIAVVREGSWMRSYVDGSPRNNDNLDRGFAGIGWWWPGSGNGHLNIGTDRTASSDYMYRGLLDEVRIYNTAIIPDDVSRLAYRKAWPLVVDSSHLIGYWTFDESGARMTVSADPVRAAMITWPGGTRTNWSPAAGAFFKKVTRVTP
jgi:hypothetical protein